MNDEDMRYYSESVTDAIVTLLKFSNMVTRNHQLQREPKPLWSLKDQINKVVEESEEILQANEHETRDRVVHENLDLIMASTTTMTINKITEEEVKKEVNVVLEKFLARGWLD